MEAAREAATVAQGTARQALTHVGYALEVARTIELVHENVQNLTEYLVTQIEGEAPPRRASGRHSRPGVPASPDERAQIRAQRQPAQATCPRCGSTGQPRPRPSADGDTPVVTGTSLPGDPARTGPWTVRSPGDRRQYPVLGHRLMHPLRGCAMR